MAFISKLSDVNLNLPQDGPSSCSVITSPLVRQIPPCVLTSAFGCFMNFLGFSFLILNSLKPLRTRTREEKEPSHSQQQFFFYFILMQFLQKATYTLRY